MDEASLKFHSGMLRAVAEGHLTLDVALDAIDAETEQHGEARREAIDWLDRTMDELTKLSARGACPLADRAGARLSVSP
jgi:hypothetical protein